MRNANGKVKKPMQEGHPGEDYEEVITHEEFIQVRTQYKDVINPSSITFSHMFLA